MRETPRRTAGAVLIAGGLIYFLAEFVAATAQTDPPYSYTYHYISNLGVRGPAEGFGQVMNSPLAWVMNTGFVLFGLTTFIGVVLLKGGRRWAMLPAFMLAVGDVLLGFFHGTGEQPDSGAVDFHAIGALLAIVGGNALIIVLGSRWRHSGIGRPLGRVLIGLGVLGLMALVGFLAIAGSDSGVIGLVERCAVYPTLIGVICAGRSLSSRTAHPGPTSGAENELAAGDQMQRRVADAPSR